MPLLAIGLGPTPKKKKPMGAPPPFPGAKKKEGAEVDVEAAPAPAPKPKAAAAPAPKPAMPASKPKPIAAPAHSGIALGDEPEAVPDGDETLRPEDVDYRSGELCGSCAHMGEDGSCTKYGFAVTPDGHCLRGYEAKHEEATPEEGGEEEAELM